MGRINSRSYGPLLDCGFCLCKFHRVFRVVYPGFSWYKKLEFSTSTTAALARNRCLQTLAIRDLTWHDNAKRGLETNSDLEKNLVTIEKPCYFALLSAPLHEGMDWVYDSYEKSAPPRTAAYSYHFPYHYQERWTPR